MKNSKDTIPPVKGWTQGVIIDTGPLLVAVASYMEFENVVEISTSRRILERLTGNDPSLRDIGFRKTFLNWLKSQRSVKTTPHILSEFQKHVLGLRPKLGSSHQTSFWEAVIEFWKEFKVEEATLRLQDKWQDCPFSDMMGTIGPTDTALIALAADVGLPILTSDYRTLTQYTRSTGVTVFQLTDLW